MCDTFEEEFILFSFSHSCRQH